MTEAVVHLSDVSADAPRRFERQRPLPGVMFDRVLLVDDSRVYRELMRTLLKPHCHEVLTAETAAAAIECVEREPGVELVLCDVVMEGDDGFTVLEHLRSARPDICVLMVTAYARDEDAKRALSLGANGYLQKPTTVRGLIEAARGAQHRERRGLPRRRCCGVATLLDPEGGTPGPLRWDVYDISENGAFLETKGPIPPGSKLHLRLEIAGHEATLRVRVVRIQEPSWLDIAGVGVEFLEPDRKARAALAAMVERSAEP